MAFAADISGTLAGLIPAQQAVVSNLASGAAPRPVRKTEKRGATASAMTPAGELLPISLIREAVQECLEESIQESSGSLSALMADDEFVLYLHQLMGKPGERETVGHSLQDVVDRFTALAARDGQPEEVVQAIDHFTARLQHTTQQLGELRARAAQQLADGIQKANELLARIAETNRLITHSGAIGRETGSAIAAQRANLDQLAQTMDFASYRREDGTVAIFTKQGVILAREQAALLTGDENGIKADGVDIAEQISGGAVHAYLRNRDVTLPNVQSQLDILAQTLQSRVNQLSNRAIGGPDARALYHGSRLFSDPARLSVALAGGDCEIALLRDDGSMAARTSLSLAIKSYRRSFGLPVSGPWPIGQLVEALDRWLAAQLPGSSGPLVRWSERATIDIALPDQCALVLALRDRRSLALQSENFAAADKPLGLQGQLTLSDGIGNEFSSLPIRGGVALSPADSLAIIAGKLDRIDGLTARLIADQQGSRLLLRSQAGSDLCADPDGPKDNLARSLGLVPAEDQPREDVVVNATLSGAGSHFTSRCFASPVLPLGLQGALVLRSLDGAMMGFQTLQPDWTLDRLVERLQNASDPRLTAAMIRCGNQFAVKLSTVSPEDCFLIDGLPQGWQTTPRFNFAAQGGDLTIAAGGRALGRMTVATGANFAQLVAQFTEPGNGLTEAGLRAQLLRAGTAEILDIGHRNGLPLSFEGSAIGPAPGQLDLHFNIRDQLGLTAPADHVVAGMANFLGLNDLFIAQPLDAFDGKIPIGVFTSTAVMGTASALALNPGLVENPLLLGHQATIRQISDLLSNSMNFAEAGGIPRGSYRVVQYAEAIMQRIHREAADNRTQLSYNRALLAQLDREKAGPIDVNHRLQALMTLQRTYHDATEIVTGLALLSEQLRTPSHAMN